MLRVLEPEIMADDDQAISYARADFARSNQAFVDGFLSEYREASGDFLDIGCGPCDVIVRLAHARPSARITAVDGSAAMIALGAQAIREAGLESRVTVMQGYIPGLRASRTELRRGHVEGPPASLARSRSALE